MTAKKPHTIVLIDGNSLAYRAFYALPDTMKTSKGIVTNAIYGFTTMLLKVLEEEPDFVAISFDLKGPTFRHKAYADYKATRQKAPPTLSDQMPAVREIAKAFDIPIYEVEGYEADDVIGTLAKEAKDQGFDVLILTGDLDTTQLVEDKIKVMSTKKGISDIIIYDEKKVKEKYGVGPKQIPDFKGLRGDPSDNIPGVPKIGEKGAAELLNEYGSLENVLEKADKIKKESIKKTIKENMDKAVLSKKLATIVTNAPIEIDFTKCKREEPNWSKVLPVFEEFEFKSLIKKYGKKTQEYDVAERIKRKRKYIKEELDYKTISNEAELKVLIEKLKESKGFAFDLETTSSNPFEAEIVGISFAYKANEACYIPLGHKGQKNMELEVALKMLKEILESDIPKYGHNIKYDIEVLLKYGVMVSGIKFDTMIAAYLIDPIQGKYSLKVLGNLIDRKMIELDELIGKEAKASNFSEVPLDLATDYACSDADVTFKLKTYFEKELKKAELLELFTKIEMPLVLVLAEMEKNGVSIDKGKLNKMGEEAEAEMKNLENDIYAIAAEEFNINSPKQLSQILFEKLKIPVVKRTKTGPSTDIEVLQELAQKFEIAQKLMDYRTLSKLKSTYIDVLPELINPKTGRIHTSFNQTITATGRLSSSNPNLQNIPAKGELGKNIRDAFVPEKKDWLIVAGDYSQIELRILAHLSGDKEFIKAFKEGKDIHRATASEVFGVPEDKITKEMRETAKTVNFGIIYGISDFGLAKSLKIKKTEAAKYIHKYFEKHKGVKEFIDKVIREARKAGCVSTMLGRKRPLPDIVSPNYSLRAFAERTAMNTPVQGTAADIIKVAMINISNIFKEKKLKCKMILQVHDELVFEVPKEELNKVREIVKKEMEEAVKLDVPVRVNIGVGKSWAEAK